MIPRRARRFARDLMFRDDRADGVIPMLAPREINRVIAAQPGFFSQWLRGLFPQFRTAFPFSTFNLCLADNAKKLPDDSVSILRPDYGAKSSDAHF
jgi:hypothetical protein